MSAVPPLRILQLTDSHLGAAMGTRLQGMDTDHSLQAVLDDVRQRQQPYDVLLATGDIALEGEATAYRRFADYTEGLAARICWAPGNHDAREVMLQDHEALMPFSFEQGNWLVLLLDSAVPGRVGGYVSEEQIQRAGAAIAESAAAHVLVITHHPLLEVGSFWIDGHRVANADRVLAACATAKGSVLSLSGHVHQAQDIAADNCRVLTSPSTCIQFAANSEDYALADLAPGYRELQLYPDGRVETQVYRVEGEFPVDLDSRGY